MRMSQAEKDKSHARIVASASRLLRERGLDGASVNDVMKEAGLTHGGFYKHFDNKYALVQSAVQEAFAPFLAMLRSGEPDAAASYRQLYLSEDHVRDPGAGCPVAALAQDIGRGPDPIKNDFGRDVGRLVDALADTMDGDSSEARRTAALQQFSMLVGAVVIARASGSDVAADVLAAVAAAVS